VIRHKGFTIWFTGLSGADKSTLSGLVEHRLRAYGAKIEVLDGDVVRENLSKAVGFSKADRERRVCLRVAFAQRRNCDRRADFALPGCPRRDSRTHPQFH
jgi:adenylylsulfate kinase-like enzyme